MGVHRLARLIFALVVAMIVVASPSTTTATAAKFTYDVPSYARVDVRNVEGAEAGPERPGLALEDSASPPSSARGTSAPRSVAFVATEAVSTPEVTLDGARYPESAAHAQDAIGGNSAEYTRLIGPVPLRGAQQRWKVNHVSRAWIVTNGRRRCSRKVARARAFVV